MSSSACELTWTTIGFSLELLFGVKKADCATRSRITASITAVNKSNHCVLAHTYSGCQSMLQ